MNGSDTYEYWDAEVKHQSKKRMALLERAIAQTGAIVTDRYEWEIFKKDKLKWRNPLLLKVKLPKGKRWEFILVSKYTIWLAKPTKLSVPDCYNERSNLPYIPLRGNHDSTTLKTRRSYRLHPVGAAYIADFRPELDGGYEIIKGADIVAAVLDGDLDLLATSPIVNSEPPAL